jgi:probable HAF family extracellular repeat protein
MTPGAFIVPACDRSGHHRARGPRRLEQTWLHTIGSAGGKNDPGAELIAWLLRKEMPLSYLLFFIRHKSPLTALLALGLAALLQVPVGAQVYRIEDLGALSEPAFRTEAYAINSRGEVAGSTGVLAAPPNIGGLRAFWWVDGAMRNLGLLNSPNSFYDASFARDLNDAGQVVGNSEWGSVGIGRAVRWTEGMPEDLGTLGGLWSSAAGINGAGQVTGDAEVAPSQLHAFLWTDGTMRDLGTLGGSRSSGAAINDAVQVVGSSLLPGDRVMHAFRWSKGVMQDLGTFGGTQSAAFAINARGQVVGWATLPARAGEGLERAHAFRWTKGQMQDLGTMDGLFSRASAINNVGDVVGYTWKGGFGARPFFYSEATGMVDLTFRIGPDRDWALEDARDINDAGRIVGWGSHHGERRAFRLTPIAGGKLSITPAALTFPATPLGRTEVRQLVLANAGPGAVGGRFDLLTEPFSVDPSEGWRFFLAAGEATAITVRFTPERQKHGEALSTTLSIVSTDPDAASVAIPIVGTVE